LVFTEVVLALLISFLGMLFAVLVGSLGNRSPGKITLLSILMFGVVLPVVLSFLFIQLMQYVTVLDWPTGGGRYIAISPPIAIFMASWLGGFLGLYAGKLWGEGNDKSCLQCILMPLSLVLLGILIVALFS